MDEWMGRWLDGHRSLDRRMIGQTEELMEALMDIQTDRQMDGWIDRHMHRPFP